MLIAARRTQYRLMINQYGVRTRTMESRLNLDGSSIRNRQRNTATAGIIPKLVHYNVSS
jgi:hypothetical protein